MHNIWSRHPTVATQEKQTDDSINVCTHVFAATLFTIAIRTGNNPNVYQHVTEKQNVAHPYHGV